MFRIGGNNTQGFRSCTKENGIKDFLVLKCYGGNLFRNSKDDVIISGGKQLRHACFKPLGFGKGLAFRAVSIAAAVI